MLDVLRLASVSHLMCNRDIGRIIWPDSCISVRRTSRGRFTFRSGIGGSPILIREGID